MLVDNVFWKSIIEKRINKMPLAHYNNVKRLDDEGCEYQKVLNTYEFRHSVNRPGGCTDNEFMESFRHTLKGEKYVEKYLDVRQT
jgi:transposase InsO family protein